MRGLLSSANACLNADTLWREFLQRFPLPPFFYVPAENSIVKSSVPIRKSVSV